VFLGERTLVLREQQAGFAKSGVYPTPNFCLNEFRIGALGSAD
jgi:hypothetical protein